jgi:signal transduction histidine kinase
MMLDDAKSERLLRIAATAAVALVLYLSSRYSYLLFHSLIEIVTISVAFTLFILTWNTRAYAENSYLKLLGIGYGFIALIDLLHTLTYKGMNIFPGYGANLPTQLWIAARYLQAATLMAAPFLMKRRIDERALLGAYFAAIVALVAIVYSGRFPECFVEGTGLTAFKIDSEYLISAVLLASLFLFYRRRRHFNDRVFLLVAGSIVCTAVSEICFTAYVSVYGFANLLGHFAKLAAFYLLYRAVLVTGLKEPFDLIFRDLKQAEEALRRSHDTLEDKVRERTAELRTSEGALRRLNRELSAISDCNQALMRADDEQALLDDICRIVCDEAGYRMVWVGYAEHDDAKTIRPVARAGADTGYLAQAGLTWADTERGRGPSGTAIRSGQSTCIQDFATDPLAAPWREAAMQRGYRSSISLPLRDENARTFGILNIYSTEPHAFTTEEKRLLNELAGDLAFGIVTLRTRVFRRRAEEDLLKLNQELEGRVAERTAQLEAANSELEAFAYSVSHDLRAPLRHIDGFLGLLKENTEGTLDEEGRRFMATISKAARHMAALIEDLLSFSRMGRSEMAKTEVDLGALLQDVIREVAPEGHDRVIHWRIAELPVVAGDRAMLRVVLVNLVSNAVKFSQKRPEAEIEIGCQPGSAAEIIVFVRDNGAGFDMTYADRLFGVFQRLHRIDEFEGTGIGLANVRRIISRHGGRTWAEGKVDGGATVYFSLPRPAAE